MMAVGVCYQWFRRWVRRGLMGRLWSAGLLRSGEGERICSIVGASIEQLAAPGAY